jgi:MFS superfamily sulfate permease-like transporter
VGRLLKFGQVPLAGIWTEGQKRQVVCSTGEESMFILLAMAFILGVFVGVVITCMLVIAKESREPQTVPGSEEALTSPPYNY